MTGADARVEREGLGKTLAIRSDGLTDPRQHVRETTPSLRGMHCGHLLNSAGPGGVDDRGSERRIETATALPRWWRAPMTWRRVEEVPPRDPGEEVRVRTTGCRAGEKLRGDVAVPTELGLVDMIGEGKSHAGGCSRSAAQKLSYSGPSPSWASAHRRTRNARGRAPPERRS